MKFLQILFFWSLFMIHNVYAQGGSFQVTDSQNESRQYANNHDSQGVLLDDGRVLVSGGVPGTGNIGAGNARITAETFDPLIGTWNYMGSLNVRRVGHQSTLLDDSRVLITGGHASSFSGAAIYNSAEIFDQLTNNFTLLGSNMIESRTRHVAVKLDDGRILIAGGHDNSGPHASAEIFDPITDNFNATGSMSVSRGGGQTATLLNNGKVLIVGSSGGIDAELYDPIAGTFTSTGSLNFSRNSHTATMLVDGRVLIVGGSFSGQARNTVEIYDPITGMFTLITATMCTPRYTHVATLLEDGRVLIAGGRSGIPYDNLASAEIFDPVTETFLIVGSLVTGRFEAIISRLQDGRVLITGGGFDSPPYSGSLGLASTELFKLDDLSDGLIGYWPFCGNANDETGNADTTIVEGPILTEDKSGNLNSAYYFDGVDDFMEVPHHPSFNFGTGDFSLCFWININQMSLMDIDVLGKIGQSTTGSVHGDNCGYVIHILEEGYPFVNLLEAGVGTTTVWPTALDLNTWYFIVGLRDNGVIKLYVNGDMKDSIPNNKNGDNEVSLIFGADIGSPFDRYLNGKMDDIRIYNRALTNSEIIMLFNEATVCPFGSISGTVFVNGNGLEDVKVILQDITGTPVTGFDTLLTDTQGQYAFTDVPPDTYLVSIIEPLGYTAAENPIADTLVSGGSDIVNFILEQAVVENNARSAFYWTRQFRLNIWNICHPQESEQDLLNYIVKVHDHYTPHFDIFQNDVNLSDWLHKLRLWGNLTKFKLARRQLAALVMNMVSGKVGQYTVVTADGRTAGDVLTYVSILLSDSDPTNDLLARRLAKKVNRRRTIDAGIIPSSSILYKNGQGIPYIEWDFGLPKEYALYQNFPNPFNPNTTIPFDLPKASQVRLEIYNIMGQRVRSLIRENRDAGRYDVTWDGINDYGIQVASGVYFYRIQTNTFTQVKKMSLMK